MEITVLDTGDLPPNTVISFHTGSVRRHAKLEENKTVNLSSGFAPVRVDLMSSVGNHTFKMVPEQEVYDVPIASGEQDVSLKFRIRDANSAKEKSEEKEGDGKEPGSPSRKLQTALMMRSYLDSHDVLRQMQELLQDMVTSRPDDPVAYMIQRLEVASQDSQGIELAGVDEFIDVGAGAATSSSAAAQVKSNENPKVNAAEKIKFSYFPFAGRGEISRLCAAAGGLDIQEENLGLSDDRTALCKECKAIGTGIPVLKHGDLAMCQSSAIQEYICLAGPKFKSLPAKARAIDAMWFRHVEDLLSDYGKTGIFGQLFGGPECDKDKLKKSVENWMAHFESQVPSVGFIAGNDLPTGADCVIITVFTAAAPWSYFFKLSGVDKASYPKCTSLVARASNVEAIKQYLAKTTTMAMDPFAKPGVAEKKPEKAEEPTAPDDSEEEEEDDDDAPDLPPPPPPGQRGPRQSVSAEAYGAFNERKAYEKKVVPKDDATKLRLKAVLRECWMFKAYTEDNMNIIVDAMSEKTPTAGEKLITQGDAGNSMWVIEDGVIECYKPIHGESKLVKTCVRGDIFGELALLYNCPRAASVWAKDACKLWELDRETFNAICFEEAQKSARTDYEGFTAPGKESKERHESKEKPPESKIIKKEGTRRLGVSAEKTKDDGGAYEAPVHAKTTEERQSLVDIIRGSHDTKLHMLFGNVSMETFEKIIDAMFLQTMSIGEHAIEQGDVGDFFYIVKSGMFDIIVKKADEAPKKVFEAGPGFAFGELALLYNAPRTATITSTVASEVWCLERLAFQKLVVESAKEQFKQYLRFLDQVDIFQVLDPGERAALAEVFEEEEFQNDEAILEQGEKDDKMFIVSKGNAVACIRGDQGEIEVMQYKSGDYFGEIALILGEPRKASVYAVGSCTCLYISRDTFTRILGPIKNLLEREMGKYEKYQDAIAKVGDDVVQQDNDKKEDVDVEEDLGNQEKRKIVHRKRERKTTTQKMEGHKIVKETVDDAATLSDKVALDFKNEALVAPTASFKLENSELMVYGGLVLGQKFTDNKAICSHGKVKLGPSGDEDACSWVGLTKLKCFTDISVVCQKGQKSESDPTPNQDNYFVHHVGAIAMYGVCDGHGPFGHLVSFRLVQALPYLLTTNPNFGKDWQTCLKEAFLAAETDLEDFCEQQGVNIDASGAAGSVLILDEQTVHIAFIGDARILLGSWNRHDTRMIFCSRDHKPQIPEEKARLEAAGMEVREIDKETYRIYLPGQNFPGLTMSRAFGDTSCKGVSREPEYHKFLMQPTDEWYAIVASDGIWEFIEGEEACNMTAKKLRLKGPRETLQFLVGASRKRWNFCCGAYCDDITGILVQWNSREKRDDDSNHALSVKRQGVCGQTS